MRVIPDTTHGFAVTTRPHLDVTAQDLFADAIAIKRVQCPDWTDESAADLGIQLLWMFSVLSRWVVDHLTRTRDNCYLASARDRESIRRLCEFLGYSLTEGTAASVVVTFSCQAGHPGFIIPKGLRVSTRGDADSMAIVFEVASAVVVPEGRLSITALCAEGETISAEVIGTSDGSTPQTYSCARAPVLWHSETIEVYELADDTIPDDAVWTGWTRVDHFIDSAPTDRHYTVDYDLNDQYVITFGDGVNGMIPPRGAAIRVSYRRGGGSVGNIAAGAVSLMDSLPYVSAVTNVAAATGGTDRETGDHARVYAPAIRHSQDRLVTTADFEAYAETFISPLYGGIARAKAFEIGGNSVSVMIVPRAGKITSAGLKSELKTYLSEKRLASHPVQVLDPTYIPVTVLAHVYLKPNHAVSQVAAEIRSRLVALISPAYQDPATGLYPHEFGRNVYKSDIIATIDGVLGVDYVELTGPIGNVIVPAYAIADLGEIDLTMHSPQTTSFTFYTTRENLPPGLLSSGMFRRFDEA